MRRLEYRLVNFTWQGDCHQIPTTTWSSSICNRYFQPWSVRSHNQLTTAFTSPPSSLTSLQLLQRAAFTMLVIWRASSGCFESYLGCCLISFDISVWSRFVVVAIVDIASWSFLVGGRNALPPDGISGAWLWTQSGTLRIHRPLSESQIIFTWALIDWINSNRMMLGWEAVMIAAHGDVPYFSLCFLRLSLYPFVP